MTKIEGRLDCSRRRPGPVALAGTGAAEVVDRIVAEVNDDIITMSELQNMAKTVEAQSGVKPKGQMRRKCSGRCWMP